MSAGIAAGTGAGPSTSGGRGGITSSPSSNNCRLLPSDCLCIGRTVSSWLSRGSLPLVP